MQRHDDDKPRNRRPTPVCSSQDADDVVVAFGHVPELDVPHSLCLAPIELYVTASRVVRGLRDDLESAIVIVGRDDGDNLQRRRLGEDDPCIVIGMTQL